MTALILHQPEDQPEGEGHSMQDYLRAAKDQYDLALGCAKQTVQHVWLMGKALTEAKEKHKLRKQKLGKDEPNWDVRLKEIGISVPSDNRARRLFEAFPQLEQVEGKKIMEAYQEAGISRLPLPKPAANVQADANDVHPDEVEEDEVSNDSTGSSGDEAESPEAESPEDDSDSEDDVHVDDRTIVDMLRDIAADMDDLREAHHTEDLSAAEIKAVQVEVERIAQFALDIKMRLDESVEAAA